MSEGGGGGGLCGPWLYRWAGSRTSTGTGQVQVLLRHLPTGTAQATKTVHDICMYVCMHVYIYIYIYNTHAHIYIYIYNYAYTYICSKRVPQALLGTFLLSKARDQVRKKAYSFFVLSVSYAYICMCVYMHIYIYIYINKQLLIWFWALTTTKSYKHMSTTTNTTTMFHRPCSAPSSETKKQKVNNIRLL